MRSALCNCWRWAFACIVWTCLLLPPGAAHASADPTLATGLLRPVGQGATTRFPANLSPGDNAWLKRHGAIVVGMWGDDYAPLQFRSSNETVEGITAEYLLLLGNALQTPVQIRWFASRAEAFAALRAQDVDALSLLGPLAESERDASVRATYLRAPLAVVRRAGPALPSNDVLKGHGVQQGDLALQSGSAPLSSRRSLYKALEAVSLGHADYYLGDLVSAAYYIEQGMFLNLRVARTESSTTHFALVFSAGRPALAHVLEAGLDAIPPWMRVNILRRWVASAAQDMENGKLSLTLAERRWIDTHPVVRVSVDAANAPYTFIDSAGEFVGMYADLLKLISRRTGLRFEIVPRDTVAAIEADLRAHRTSLVTTLIPTVERRHFLSFTTAIEPMAWAIVTRRADQSVSGLDSLNGKQLALTRGHGMTDLIRTLYPGIKVVSMRTATDALDLVARGRADATLLSMAGASYAIERYFDGRLHIAATSLNGPDLARFGVSSQQPELLGILNKSLLSIAPSERAGLASKWLVNINYPTGTWDSLRRSVFRWLPWIFGALALIIGWNSLLQYQIRRRKQLESELRIARDVAERANREKTDFLAVMSHEIRTPMSAVIGLLEMAHRSARAGVTDAQPLALAEASARGLLDLVGDLLDLSKIEAGELTLTPRAVNLRALLADISALFTHAAQAKGLHLRHSIAAEVPEWVWLDPVRMRQIVANLLSNAVKFTEKGSITLTARLEHTATTEAAMLLITVSDTGHGIAASELPLVFEPFHQASSPAAHMGTGLGLVIVKRLVLLMNGLIALTSEPGCGTEASVTLPCLAVKGEEQPQAQLWFAQTPLRILAVDDHPINLRILSDQLNWLGYHPIAAVNASEALQQIALGVDLILTDCNMPVTSGIELTQQIRAAEATHRQRHCPVIGLTANALPEAREACLAAGMDDVLVKPLDLAQISRVLAHWFPGQVTRHQAQSLALTSMAMPSPSTSAMPAGLAESLREDGLALRHAVSAEKWQVVADLSHRIRGVMSCTLADPDLDQACLVLEMQASRSLPARAAITAQLHRVTALLALYVANEITNEAANEVAPEVAPAATPATPLASPLSPPASPHALQLSNMFDGVAETKSS
ncbi:transporter substrate-binding domain-containing protein [Paraburkholderia bonniea]|uniref:ATP-binding protein n=1 Tax=Paraburkholderia bonniea TaxID=2152891 RepID=UPI0025741DCB|nr:transporter substrate-binding domain-containing protein [Paraburkholderia bonniea]WJF89841.1 transporter substrate-binding domain-containing protein [Paraburkholderia bonniea]WJF93155.1 transporter substrate-binding domain-containing protein [Paraburkholderia bonniea]